MSLHCFGAVHYWTSDTPPTHQTIIIIKRRSRPPFFSHYCFAIFDLLVHPSNPHAKGQTKRRKKTVTNTNSLSTISFGGGHYLMLSVRKVQQVVYLRINRKSNWRTTSSKQSPFVREIERESLFCGFFFLAYRNKQKKIKSQWHKVLCSSSVRKETYRVAKRKTEGGKHGHVRGRREYTYAILCCCIVVVLPCCQVYMGEWPDIQ